MRQVIVLVLSLATFFTSEVAAGKENFRAIYVTSPNGKVAVRFALKENLPYPKGIRPYYSVSYNKITVVKDSPLGIEMAGSEALGRNLELTHVIYSTLDENYTPIYSAKRNIRNRCKEATISLREKINPYRKVDIIFRAYDEGIAFRYAFPKQRALSKFTVIAENSIFCFPPDYTAWAMQLGKYTSNYESEFSKISLWAIRPESIVGLPLLIDTKKGVWMAITEANINNYPGMYLSGVHGMPEVLVSKLSPLPTDRKAKAKVSTPFQTPWRVLLLGERPGALIEHNYLVMNLNEPSAIANSSWIKPGKAAWHWWNGTVAKGVPFQPGMNTATLKHYVDFAFEHHLEYLIIDEGWYVESAHETDITKWAPELNLPEIVQYAKIHKVGIILWLRWNWVEAQMARAFPVYEQWGVAGIKIDFMNRDDQEMVNFYRRVARKAAHHRLLVNLHGSYKPDGMQRTWPNVITWEGVLGLEWNRFSRRCTPEHDVTIPFTRMLAGPMDYTPGAFRTATRDQFKPLQREPVAQGTRCHQLAMYVIYESPLQTLADYPEAYRNQVGTDFLVKVPTTWDETKVIHVQVGDYITIARKRGQEWYVGSMTDWNARVLEIPLGFLGKGRFLAEIYSDAKDGSPSSIAKQRRVVTAADRMIAKLAPGGGHVMRLFPAVVNAHSP